MQSHNNSPGHNYLRIPSHTFSHQSDLTPASSLFPDSPDFGNVLPQKRLLFRPCAARTYSLHNTMNFLPIQETLNCCQIRTIPVSSSAVCRHIRIVFVYSHLYQISFLCFWKFPLFPYTHAYSVVEPSVDLFDVVLHACYSVIVQPSSCIYLDFLKAWLD